MNSTLAGPNAVALPDEHVVGHITYRRDIDGLRAIAVLGVLIFHAFPTYLTGGFVGVDVFFVISGYLISKVIVTALERGDFSVAEFYVRRIRRIFPSLLVVLVFCLAFGWKTLLAEDLEQLAKHVFGGATFSSNLFLWHEAGYFDKASESKPLLHLWSLGIEEQFYVVWPLVLWFAWRSKLSLLPVVCVVAAASFVLNVTGLAVHPTATFYSPLSRAWELLIGAGLSQLSSRAEHATRQRFVGWFSKAGLARPAVLTGASVLGLALIVFSAFFLDSSRAFPGWWALLPTLGAALIIAAGPDAGINRKILSSRAFVAVGLISYPLYLWHWPLLTLVRNALLDGGSATVRLALLLVSLILAWITYQFVEKPFRLGKHVGLKVTLLCGLMIFVACLAGFTVLRGGVPSRYPEIIQRATEYDLAGYRAALRDRKCFMEPGQDFTSYAAECVDGGSQPLWLLWGDSGAATLYPGLRGLSDRSGAFRLAQFTSSACPPILGGANSDNPSCKANNEWTLDTIKKLRPQVVVVSAIWGEYDRSRLAETIAAIRQLGVRRVIIVGPAPTWKDTPSHIVFNVWKEDPLHRVPPARLNYQKYGLGQGASIAGSPDIKASSAEASLEELAAKSGASYISVFEVLCNDDGCLMRKSDKSGDAFYLDIVHLNPRGSDFVVRALAKQLGIADPTGSNGS
jgi:peptidoglycan/LPS O-acetylase OafA/YrhL